MKHSFRLIAAVIAILLLVLLCIALVRGVSNVLQRGEINTSEPDPMFETPAEIVTRPPDLYPEETQPPRKTLDDYIPEIETPVDKTAADLIAEARAGE